MFLRPLCVSVHAFCASLKSTVPLCRSYVNQYTNETTWTKPPIPPPAATVAAPPGVAELSPLHTAGADHEEEGVGWRKQITAAEQDKDHVLRASHPAPLARPHV